MNDTWVDDPLDTVSRGLVAALSELDSHPAPRPDAAHPFVLRAPQACQLAGITYRQIDYWARTGLVVPSIVSASGPGSQRLYAPGDVLALRVVKQLLDCGVSLQRIRQVTAALAALAPLEVREQIIVIGRHAIVISAGTDELLELLAAGGAVVCLSISRLARDLDNDLLAGVR